MFWLFKKNICKTLKGFQSKPLRSEHSSHVFIRHWQQQSMPQIFLTDTSLIYQQHSSPFVWANCYPVCSKNLSYRTLHNKLLIFKVTQRLWGKELDTVPKQFAVMHLCVFLGENDIFQLNIVDFKFPRNNFATVKTCVITVVLGHTNSMYFKVNAKILDSFLLHFA